jgi:hypothetical protein
MSEDEDSIWCDGCGIEIRWRPLIAGKFVFCCTDCLHGYHCDCLDGLDIEDERREGKSIANIAADYS